MSSSPLKFLLDPTSFLPSVNRWLLLGIAVVALGVSAYFATYPANHRPLDLLVIAAVGVCVIGVFAFAMAQVRRLDFRSILTDRSALWSHGFRVMLAIAPLFAIPSVVGTYGLQAIDSTGPHLPPGVSSMNWHERDGRYYASQNGGPDVEISEAEYRDADQGIVGVFALVNRMFAYLGFCLAWMTAFWPFGVTVKPAAPVT